MTDRQHSQQIGLHNRGYRAHGAAKICQKRRGRHDQEDSRLLRLAPVQRVITIAAWLRVEYCVAVVSRLQHSGLTRAEFGIIAVAREGLAVRVLDALLVIWICSHFWMY